MEDRSEDLFSTKEELSKIKLSPIWETTNRPYGDLGEFVNNYAKYNETKKILVWVGFLGAGKTRFRKLASRYRKLYSELSGQSLKHGIITWEDEENRAREVGDVLTPKGKSLESRELNAVSRNFEKQLTDAIHEYDDIEAETPLLTSVNLEQDIEKSPRFVGRELGLKAFYNLVRFQGKEFIDLPACDVWVAGLCAGVYLREVVPPFRDGIRFAKSLQEAQAMAILCGLDPPQDDEGWRLMQLDGASVEETEEVNEQFEREVVPIYRRIRSQSSSMYSRMVIECDLMDFILRDDYNLGLTPERCFVGFNDPELSSPNKKLFNEFVNSQGKLRLDMEQISSLLNHIPEAAD